MAYLKMLWQTDDSDFQIKVKTKIRNATDGALGVKVKTKIRNATDGALNVTDGRVLETIIRKERK